MVFPLWLKRGKELLGHVDLPYSGGRRVVLPIMEESGRLGYLKFDWALVGDEFGLVAKTRKDAEAFLKKEGICQREL